MVDSSHLRSITAYIERKIRILTRALSSVNFSIDQRDVIYAHALSLISFCIDFNPSERGGIDPSSVMAVFDHEISRPN